MTTVDVRQATALDTMRTLPDNSVNLIMTSPPYAMRRANTYGGIKENEYVPWFLHHAQEMQRILAPDGSFVLNIKEHAQDGQKSLYVMQLVIALVEQQGWRLVDEYIWHKTNPAPGKWNNRFRDGWEHCYHFTRNKHFVMNQEAVMQPVGDWAKTRPKNVGALEADKKRASSTGSGFTRNLEAYKNRELVYPSNVLHGAAETRNQGHPAVFPVWLPEFFIKLFSNENDTVFDPFAGSGTTGVAAVKNNRNFIGCDMVEDYVQLALSRIAKETEH